MSHIYVRMLTTQATPYIGRNWFFEYKELPIVFNDDDIICYVQNLEKDFAELAKVWTPALNTEWLLRHYLALKMILSATVLLTSCEYSVEKNIRITEHYLQYYAILSCLRSILYTTPRSKWNDGSLVSSTHSKIINFSTNVLSSISKEYGESVNTYSFLLKSLREILSYGAPSSGPSLYDEVSEVNIDMTTSYCKLLAEISQMQSEILERALNKYYTGKFSLLEDPAWDIFLYPIPGGELLDKEDYHRVGYYYRKWPKPTNLLLMISEGHVEDYFGAWCSKDGDTTNQYDPDANWRLIFPFP